MRIISGLYKGRTIKGYDLDGTRATMDRVKESLFASLQNLIPNKTCLDLFAGTGSLGFEALSMGASKCIFVDSNKKATDTILENIKTIDIRNTEVFNLDYKKAINYFKEVNETFDIVFLDPPYHKNMINQTIKDLIDSDILNDNAIIISEFEEENVSSNLSLVGFKNYGSKNIKIYKYNKLTDNNN